MLRTHHCGELNEKDLGKEVVLCGWVDSLRDHGGVAFLDLRDRYGKTQVVAAGNFKPEDCIRVKGKVKRRPAGTENPKIKTGAIEIVDAKGELLNKSDALPFEITKSHETNEELRLKYRFLDLRNPVVQRNLFLRHHLNQAVRGVLTERDFIEVETPILTKSTPEGARDYLVPSRLNPGEFYALPQSPQLFKQILMVAGFDRYFQIARCFRDEDLRADRQPEFTQLDMEMSFLEENDLFHIIEEVLKEIFNRLAVAGVNGHPPLLTPFPRLTYEQAMSRYGSDKPDLRFGLEFEDVSNVVKNASFKIFQETLSKENGYVAGFCVQEWGTISRKEIDDLTAFVKAEGGLGLAYFKVGAPLVGAHSLESPIAKFFDDKIQKDLIEKFKAKVGDLILLIADKKEKASKILGVLRNFIGQRRGLIPKNKFHFSWVTDFPLFKRNEDEKRWESEHHPFTAPVTEDWENFKNSKSADLSKIRSRAYDLVLNGNEIASGSVRIHSEHLQKEIFEAIGIGAEEAQVRFGFLLKALKFSAPPHGGIALGLDRLAALLLGLESIREVIAFPKNQKAVCPMTDAPSPVNERQLKELGIKIR